MTLSAEELFKGARGTSRRAVQIALPGFKKKARLVPLGGRERLEAILHAT
jgi:hypothetical protein